MGCLPLESLHAQIFPGLEGEVLADAIRDEYAPTQLLNFTQAKDTLYARIFIEGDSVRCIYSGLAHYLPSGVDPSQWVFGSGSEVNSINLEHGWPQAKGAGDGTNGQMNMYNLFPSRVAVNSDRGDYPYHNIDDNLTQKWYYLGQELTTKPASNADAYSEFETGFFEPRESVKGDIARAMFYFWTIYRQDAIAADPAYFEMQRESLCLWHEEDPVDDFEALRNERIASYQGGKENPFVLDCSLVNRAYCSQNMDCSSVPVAEVEKPEAELHFDISGHRVQILSDFPHRWNLVITSISGAYVYATSFQNDQWCDPIQLGSGVYVAIAYSGQEKVVSKFFIP